MCNNKECKDGCNKNECNKNEAYEKSHNKNASQSNAGHKVEPKHGKEEAHRSEANRK